MPLPLGRCIVDYNFLIISLLIVPIETLCLTLNPVEQVYMLQQKCCLEGGFGLAFLGGTRDVLLL